MILQETNLLNLLNSLGISFSARFHCFYANLSDMARVHSTVVVAFLVWSQCIILLANLAQAVTTGEIYSLDNYIDGKVRYSD